MTYYVFSGTLNSTQSINQACPQQLLAVSEFLTCHVLLRCYVCVGLCRLTVIRSLVLWCIYLLLKRWRSSIYRRESWRPKQV